MTTEHGPEHEPDAEAYVSLAEAATRLEVTVPTVEKLVQSGVLPVERVLGDEQDRIPTPALLSVAAEIAWLREQARRPGLLAEALRRLAQEDPELREQFEALSGPALAPASTRDEFVSAAPGEDWDPEDEWDVNALAFDEEGG